jgi:hypothetical protein
MNNLNKKRTDKTVKDSSDFDDDIQETNLDQVKHNKWLESQSSEDLEKIAKNAGDWMRKRAGANKAQE